MKIENQVCSLEYASKLKELKIRQSALCTWILHPEYGEKVLNLPYAFYANCDVDDSGRKYYSAFSVAELGQILHKTANEWAQGWDDCHCQYIIQIGGRGAGHMIEDIGTAKFIDAATEADARALMLIYLLEKNLVTAEQINAATEEE